MTKRWVLVVDDDLNLCRDITAYMQDKNTYICCMASASEALDCMVRVNYCLPILSNHLPGTKRYGAALNYAAYAAFPLKLL